MADPVRIQVSFFQYDTGFEPVRSWLHSLSREDRQAIGLEIKTVQIGWPLGMPIVRKLESGLWEVRISLRQGIARVLFTLVDGGMVLLHGFVKKDRRTPLRELRIARRRKSLVADR